MPPTKILAIAVFSILIVGCATGPRPYDPAKSAALNLAELGGIDGLKDQTVSPADYSNIQSSGASVLTDIGWSGASYSAPPPGISGGLSFGLGLLSMIRSTDSPAKHRQLVAWMPQSMASDTNDAQEKMRSITISAIDKALAEMGWQRSEFELSRRESKIIAAAAFHSMDVPQRCAGLSAPLTEKCIVGAYIQTPVETNNSPAIITQSSQPSYVFKGDAIFNGYISIVTRGQEINLQQFYIALSNHLPPWSYFYIPPKAAMKAHAAGNLDYPQIYFRGKMELFVTAQK
ncbi:hypothetical protein ABRZ04_12915 [Castellaniella ginsengisoli]|uniref:Lipoprotein n=1 Tax=Castellaniella ginsengisoli TaxID=546114 RepID=A0AB39CXY0_9BURK